MQTRPDSRYVVLWLGRWYLHLEFADHEAVGPTNFLAAGSTGLSNFVKGSRVVALPACGVEAGCGDSFDRASTDEPGLNGFLVVHSGCLALLRAEHAPLGALVDYVVF